MELVYHEKQEGRLCGQHCLNNLLQGQYFTAVELAALARQMDLAERKHMAEAGVHTEDFIRFMQQPSGNMDDTGMFSVQVLTSALRVWDLSLVPITSTSSTLARAARSNPQEQQAFICNYKAHWFTVRKLGFQWFNLNSLLSYPELISNTYLSLFLTQLEHEGYAIFVVEGSLPPSEADDSLRLHPAQQHTPPQLSSQVSSGSSTTQEEEEELKEALALSLSFVGTHPLPPSPCSSSSSAVHQTGREDSEDDDLQQALLMSLSCEVDEGEGQVNQPAAVAVKTSPEGGSEDSRGGKKAEERREISMEEVRERRLNYLAKKGP